MEQSVTMAQLDKNDWLDCFWSLGEISPGVVVLPLFLLYSLLLSK